jgi:hypothetical protein
MGMAFKAEFGVPIFLGTFALSILGAIVTWRPPSRSLPSSSSRPSSGATSPPFSPLAFLGGVLFSLVLLIPGMIVMNLLAGPVIERTGFGTTVTANGGMARVIAGLVIIGAGITFSHLVKRQNISYSIGISVGAIGLGTLLALAR